MALHTFRNLAVARRHNERVGGQLFDCIGPPANLLGVVLSGRQRQLLQNRRR